MSNPGANEHDSISWKARAVVVDPERLQSVLHRVSDGVVALRRYGADQNGLSTDALRLNALKYLFVTAAEGCIDAANHVCASEGWGPPRDNADAMRLLAGHEVIDKELAEEMARMVGFRNVLVHEYRRTDDTIVIANLDRLGALDRFIADLSTLLE